MKILLILLVFVSELTLSYLADMRNVYVVSRKKYRALFFDMGASVLAWGILIIVVVTQEWTYIIGAILGSGLGTFLAASRKIKRRKTGIKRKIPTTTA